MSTDLRGEELRYGRQLFPDHLKPARPAAGAPLIAKAVAPTVCRLLAARFTLTTSAAVANRFVTVDYADDEGSVWLSYPAVAVQAAGVANQVYSFGRRNGAVSAPAGAPQFCELEPLWLPLAWQIQINVAAIDAGDQLDNIRLYVEKLLSDQS